ncbi:MAK10-like protein [Tanacetum coccineum]
MGEENPIHTLGNYSKPSHEGYGNTIVLPEGNNVVPLRSDTIRLVQNGCSFHGLRSENPNQHLKDFLKLDPSPHGRILLLVSLFNFLSGRTAKLRNDILMFQQHQGESLSEAWTRFKDLLQKFPHHGIDLWLQVQIFYDHVNPATRRTIDQSAGGKLRDRNAKESWALLEDLALYDNESWNDPRDFAKLVKAISLPQDVPSTSDRRLIELENQVQRLMEAHLAPKQPIQVNKITSSCEICSGPHDTQYCMENPEQAFVDYQAKLERTLSEFDSHQERRLSSLGAQLGRQQDDMINKINVLWKVFSEKLDDTFTRDTAGDFMAHKDEVREKENVKPNTTEYNDHEIIVKAEEMVEEESEDEFEEEIKEEEEEEEEGVEYFDTFPSLDELRYHEWLLKTL